MAKKQNINNNDPISKAVDLLLEPVWNVLNIIKLKKGIIISNLTVN
ncbi:hypothetical protein [Spiroplasma endosymbiont of Dactylopius coccus]